jgi:hypothetical protein
MEGEGFWKKSEETTKFAKIAKWGGQYSSEPNNFTTEAAEIHSAASRNQRREFNHG